MPRSTVTVSCCTDRPDVTPSAPLLPHKRQPLCYASEIRVSPPSLFARFVGGCAAHDRVLYPPSSGDIQKPAARLPRACKRTRPRWWLRWRARWRRRDFQPTANSQDDVVLVTALPPGRPVFLTLKTVCSSTVFSCVADEWWKVMTPPAFVIFEFWRFFRTRSRYRRPLFFASRETVSVVNYHVATSQIYCCRCFKYNRALTVMVVVRPSCWMAKAKVLLSKISNKRAGSASCCCALRFFCRSCVCVIVFIWWKCNCPLRH